MWQQHCSDRTAPQASCYHLPSKRWACNIYIHSFSSLWLKSVRIPLFTLKSIRAGSSLLIAQRRTLPSLPICADNSFNAYYDPLTNAPCTLYPPRNNINWPTPYSSLLKKNSFFRKLCNYLQSGVVSKFPESDQIKKNFAAIGGLLFLRFFCPAIFAPKTFGLVKGNPILQDNGEPPVKYLIFFKQKAHPRPLCARYC